MKIFIDLLIILLFFMFMEFFAWFVHKFVMHGPLWVLHEDHHRPHKSWYEKNDLFTLFFASIAVFLLFLGVHVRDGNIISMGLGVTLYGIGYFLFHDMMFHRRIKAIKLKASTPYLKRIMKAHAIHHRKTDKHQGTAFGFLWASRKYDV